MPDNLLENLNEEQLVAAMHADGPLMIIAGAGTGKTTVITHRIAWLIEQGKAKPEEILALTFTEKAASEMEERVDRLLPMGYLDLWISTFHSFCERILRAHAIEIGVPHEFTLLNEVDAMLLVRKHFDEFQLDYYRPRGNPTRFVKALLSHFSRLKDETITPQEYLDYAESLQMNADTSEGVAAEDNGEELAEIARVKELANAYHRYQQLLLDNNALDFGDLIAYTIELFKKRPNILKKYQEQFKFILVDEFQDTNFAQYELVKMLAKGHGNIAVVGDDDQSIYKFRGASLSNIMRFRDDYPNAKSIILNKNYRSTKEILGHAYELIQKNNPDRLEAREELDKSLHAQTEELGLVKHLHCKTVDEEVEQTVKTILDIQQKEHTRWSDFAILVRANESAKPFAAALERLGIPYRFLAMAGLYTKPVILDALAFMRAVDQPHDSPSMYRILSHPRLGVSETVISQLTLYSRRKASSLADSMKNAGVITEIGPDGQGGIRDILHTLSELASSAKRLPVSEFFVEVMKHGGLLGDIRQMSEFEQQEQFGYLQQFYERLKKFESAHDDVTLHHFLEEFEHERDAGESGSLATDIEAGPDVVNIMTIHASKGLEFPYVFIVNMVEQRFPAQNRKDPIDIPAKLVKDKAVGDEKLHHIQEERRLFYVAMTRAKKGLFLLSAEDYGGTRKRKPSRFLQEINLTQHKSEINSGADAFEKKQEAQKQTEAHYTLPASISFTQVAAFSTCPLQYKFAHILKVPVFGRHSLSFGKTMHNTLQKFTELIYEQQLKPQTSLFDNQEENTVDVPDKRILLDLYKECWIDEWYPSQAIREEYMQKGKESLSRVYEDVKKSPPNIAHIEKGFTLKIGDITVKGRIDRIDHDGDGVEIIDYKTGSPKDKLSWQDKRQLVLYQLAAETCFDPPLKVNRLSYHYLEDNSKVSFEAKEKEKEKLEQEILNTVDAIKSSDFSADPGFHCQYCDFKDICEFSQA